MGDIDALGATIRRVADGGTVVDPQVVDALMAGRTLGEGSTLDRLTDREREVLAEMAKGASNAAIGDALHISARSVEKHISAIFTKLDLQDTDAAHRRVQAVLRHLGVGGR